MAGTGDVLWAGHLVVLAATFLGEGVLASVVYTRHWDQRGARAFLVLMLTGMVWMGAEFGHVLLSDPQSMRVAYYVGAYGAVLTISMFVVFASMYANAGFHRRRPVQAVLVLIVGGYTILAPTDSVHHLIFTGFTPVTEPFPHLKYDRGPAFELMVTVLSLLAVYSIYRMGEYLLAAQRRAGRQLLMLIVGAMTIIVLEVLGNFGLMPVSQFSYAAYGMLPSTVLTTLALFRFGLLDVQPIARSSVVENLRDPVVVLDADRTVVDSNQASTRIWPDITESAGAPFETVCPSLAERLEIPPAADGDGNRVAFTTDGRTYHYSVTVSEVDRPHGDGTGWYAVLLRDVTELEQSRRQLESQNDRLDQVASTISHDLRNPINVASGHLEIALGELDDDGMDPDQVAEVRESLERARDPHGRMEDIIDDILTIAREGKTVEETEAVDLESVARDAWGNVDTLEATLTVTEDVTFQADRSKLLTILENLFRNALDHGPPSVTVEVSPTEDGFAVADDGPGIPPEHADSVFEYGYTTGDGGTGLGLSIVKTMAESHGWTVDLDEGYDAGARFVFGSVRLTGLHDDSEPGLVQS